MTYRARLRLSQHWAAYTGWRASVEFLLHRGADPTIRDPVFDATAAGWAREGGYPALGEILDDVGT